MVTDATKKKDITTFWFFLIEKKRGVSLYLRVVLSDHMCS